MGFAVLDLPARQARAVVGPCGRADFRAPLRPEPVADHEVRGVQPLGNVGGGEEELRVQAEGDDLSVAKLPGHSADQETPVRRVQARRGGTARGGSARRGGAHAPAIRRGSSLSLPSVLR